MRTLFSSLELTLDIYEGPLDIFVHLVKRKEVKDKEIQLKDLFNSLNPTSLDLEMASHFLEQFSYLMLFRSLECLPFEEEKKDEHLAPPIDAIHHLADYYQFKEIAFALDSRQEEESCRFPRGTHDLNEPIAPPVGIEQISIDELQKVFQKLLDKLPQTPTIHKDPCTLSDGKAKLQEAFNGGNFSLSDFLAGIESRQLLIVTFLALLELMKEGTILVKEDLMVERL